MKTQALLLPFLTLACMMAAAPALADCVLLRQYRDDKRIMHHFSLQTLKEGNDIASSCTSICRTEAVYIPAIDATKLRGNDKVKEVLLRCTFSVGHGAKPESGRVLAESTLPITSLRIRKEIAPTRPNAAPYAISPRAPAISSSNTGFEDAEQESHDDSSQRYPQPRASDSSKPFDRTTRPIGTTRY